MIPNARNLLFGCSFLACSLVVPIVCGTRIVILAIPSVASDSKATDLGVRGNKSIQMRSSQGGGHFREKLRASSPTPAGV